MPPTEERTGFIGPDQLRFELAAIFDDCFRRTPAPAAQEIWDDMARVFRSGGGHLTAWEALRKALVPNEK